MHSNAREGVASYPVAGIDEHDVAVSMLLVPDRKSLRARHAIIPSKHEEHTHATASGIAHSQLLPNPQPPVKVCRRSDDAHGQ